MTAALLAGVLAGLGVAVPVGAVSTLIVLLGAQHGWRVGAAAGLGAATVDGAYATVALLAGALLAPVLTAWRTPLRWVSAAVLVAIAVRLLRRAWRPRTPADERTAPGALRAYGTFVAVTALNPATVVYFAALVVGGPAPVGRADGAAFVLGAFAASAAWQLAVAAVGAGAGRALTGERGRRWTAVAGAAIVAALAVRTALGL